MWTTRRSASRWPWSCPASSTRSRGGSSCAWLTASMLDEPAPDAYDRPMSAPAAVFFAYADVPARRMALGAPAGSPERYRLFGLDEVAARGVRVSHNLERPGAAPAARLADRIARSLVEAVGGYSGDFASILASLRA